MRAELAGEGKDPSESNKLTIDAISKMSAQSVNKLTIDAISKMSAQSVNKLTIDAISKMSAQSVNKLTIDAISKMSAQSVNKLAGVWSKSDDLHRANRFHLWKQTWLYSLVCQHRNA